MSAFVGFVGTVKKCLCHKHFLTTDADKIKIVGIVGSPTSNADKGFTTRHPQLSASRNFIARRTPSYAQANRSP